MHLHSQRFYVVSAVCASCEVAEVELDLIPPVVQSHRHSADERLHPSGGLVVGGSEAAPHILVVQHLHLEGEVFLQVLDDHHQEGQLDAEGGLGVSRAGDEVGGHVGAHELQH